MVLAENGNLGSPFSGGAASPYSSDMSSPGGLPSPPTVVTEYNRNVEVNPNATHLVITEEPQSKFRFRYKSEMAGTHGQLKAERAEKNKAIFPTVKLMNWNEGPALIRLALYTADDNVNSRIRHVHELNGKNCFADTGICEMVVDQETNYTASFQNLGIVHIAKRDVSNIIKNRKNMERIEIERDRNPDRTLEEIKHCITITDLKKIEEEADEITKQMDLNKVVLRFRAFYYDSNVKCYIPITPPVDSAPVVNLKNASTGELKIVRMSECSAPCTGGTEVWMLVEKVRKSNIKIKFYELDQDGREAWNAYGEFSEADVHHQYAIIFRTPPYRDTNLRQSVRVKVQLERPNDKDISEPRDFTYYPESRKRQSPFMETTKMEEDEDYSYGGGGRSNKRMCHNTPGAEPLNLTIIGNSDCPKEGIMDIFNQWYYNQVSDDSNSSNNSQMFQSAQQSPHYIVPSPQPAGGASPSSNGGGSLYNQQPQVNRNNINFTQQMQQSSDTPSVPQIQVMVGNNPPYCINTPFTSSSNGQQMNHQQQMNQQNNINGGDKFKQSPPYHAPSPQQYQVPSPQQPGGIYQTSPGHQLSASPGYQLSASPGHQQQPEYQQTPSPGGYQQQGLSPQYCYSNTGSPHDHTVPTSPNQLTDTFMQSYDTSGSNMFTTQRVGGLQQSGSMHQGGGIHQNQHRLSVNVNNTTQMNAQTLNTPTITNPSTNNVFQQPPNFTSNTTTTSSSNTSSSDNEWLCLLQNTGPPLETLASLDSYLDHSSHVDNLFNAISDLDTDSVKEKAGAKQPSLSNITKTTSDTVPNTDNSKDCVDQISDSLRSINLTDSRKARLKDVKEARPSLLQQAQVKAALQAPYTPKPNVLAGSMDVAFMVAISAAESLQAYAATGDTGRILATHRYLLAVQNNQGDNALHTAVVNSNWEAFKMILAASRELRPHEMLNTQNYVGETPLHLAVRAGELPMAERLISCPGIDVSLVDRAGNTPLHLAAAFNKQRGTEDGVMTPSEILARLLTRTVNGSKSSVEASLQASNYQGETALHVAVTAHNTAVVKVLVQAGGAVHLCEGKRGANCLHLAAQYKCHDIARYLISHTRMTVNSRMFDGNTALHIAAQERDPIMCALLLEAGADPHAKNWLKIRKAKAAESKADEDEDNEEDEDNDEDEDEDDENEEEEIEENDDEPNCYTPIDYACDCPEVLKVLLNHSQTDVKSQNILNNTEKCLETADQSGEKCLDENITNSAVLDSGIDI